jgi:fumarate reductase flavoprotein subunit
MGAAPLPGLFAAGECASSGIHGANRLGSNSLAELCVFGKVAGESAAAFAKGHGFGHAANLKAQALEARERAAAPLQRKHGTEKLGDIRNAMAKAMEAGCGIYRTGPEMEQAVRDIALLRQRAQHIRLQDKAEAWNTEWLGTLELQYQLEVAQAMVHSAIARKESRGAHQRLDAGCTERDDEQFLKHTLATMGADGAPVISYSDVVITRSQPGTRAYGAAGEAAEKAEKAHQQSKEKQGVVVA